MDDLRPMIDRDLPHLRPTGVTPVSEYVERRPDEAAVHTSTDPIVQESYQRLVPRVALTSDEVPKLQATIDRQRVQLDTLTAEREALQNDAELQQAEGRRLRDEISVLSQEAQERGRLLVERYTHITDLEKDAVIREQRIADLINERGELIEESIRYKTRAIKAEQRLDHTATLESTIRGLSDQLAALTTQFDRVDEIRKTLLEEAAEHDARVARLQEQHDADTAQFEQFNREIRAKDVENASLRRQLDAADPEPPDPTDIHDSQYESLVVLLDDFENHLATLLWRQEPFAHPDLRLWINRFRALLA